MPSCGVCFIWITFYNYVKKIASLPVYKISYHLDTVTHSKMDCQSVYGARTSLSGVPSKCLIRRLIATLFLSTNILQSHNNNSKGQPCIRSAWEYEPQIYL